MKKIVMIVVSASSLLVTLNADEVESAYKQLVTTSMFTSNNLTLQTGWYSLDGVGGNNADLDNMNFVGSYYFGNKNDTFRPFILGGFGFSDITQDKIDLHRSSGTIDKAEFDSMYWKLGGGLNYNPTSNLGLIIGGSAMWYNSDSGNYDTKVKLDMSDSKDKKIKQFFDEESDNTLYDIFGSAVYHPVIAGYHTYFEGTLHYLNFDYDHSVSDTDGFNLDLKAGFYTNTLTTLYQTPVWMEFFVAANLLDSDLSDLVGFDSAFTGGTSVHWKIGPYLPNFMGNAFNDLDVSFNLQGTTSNTDFDGWKASASLSLMKF